MNKNWIHLDWIALNSSTVKEVAFQTFSGDFGSLHIRFKSGTTYEYLGVEKEIFQGLCEAQSPGKYFHNNIKQRYEWRQDYDYELEEGWRSRRSD